MDPKKPDTRLGREEVSSEEQNFKAARSRGVDVTPRREDAAFYAQENQPSPFSSSRVKSTYKNPFDASTAQNEPQSGSESNSKKTSSRVKSTPKANANQGAHFSGSNIATSMRSGVVDYVKSKNLYVSPEDDTDDYRSSILNALSQKGKEKDQTKINIRALAKKISDKLNSEIEKGNAVSAFTLALGLALFKDVLDMGVEGAGTLIQGIPVIGQALYVVVKPLHATISSLLAITLFLFMQGKGMFLTSQTKLTFWLLSLLDIVPFVSFIPTQTVSVIHAWKNVTERAEKAEKKQKTLSKMTPQLLNKLDKNFEQEVDAVEL